MMVISFATVKDNAVISGIEIAANPGGHLAPVAPTDVQATAVTSNSATLHWQPSSSSGVTYNIYRSTSSGFNPQDSYTFFLIFWCTS